MRYQPFFHSALFEETYHDFLHQDIVVSQPLSFHWIQQNTFFAQNTLLKQKIPLKVYLGAVFSSQQKTRIINCRIYNPYTQAFEEHLPQQFIPRLRDLEEYLQERFSSVLEISLLCDIPPGRGLCFFQSIALLLASLYFLEEHRWPLTILSQLYKTTEHTEILRTEAQHLYTIMTGDASPLFYPIGMYAGNAPILCHQTTIAPLGSTNDTYQNIPLPFHTALIYSGKPSSASIQQQRSLKIQQQLSPHPPPGEYFFKDINPLLYTAQYLEQITAQTAQCFLDIQKDGPLPEYVERLFALFDMSTAQVRYLEELHPQLNRLLEHLEHLTALHPNCKTTILPIGTTKVGGSIILCFTEQGLGNTLRKWVQEQQSKGYAYSLDYISTEQRPCPTEGITVHSYQKRHLLPAITTSSISITHIQNGSIQKQSYQKETYTQLRQQQPLCLDMVDKRMYLQGKKLTAQDIPSQTSTIQILKKLLEHFKNGEYRIANTDLPYSSYSSSRNEMVSKIVSPLQRSINKYTSHTIDIRCSGSLEEFDLILTNPPFPITIREKAPHTLLATSHNTKQSICYKCATAVA